MSSLAQFLLFGRSLPAASRTILAIFSPVTGCGDKATPHGDGSATTALPSSATHAGNSASASVAARPPASGASTNAGKPEPPPGMVYIEGATFDALDHTGKATSTTVKSFYIDKGMITNEALLHCVDEKKCPSIDGLTQLTLKKAPPSEFVVGISYKQAKEYCTAVGKRLPKSAEWQLAARGKEGRKYPWGNEEPKPASSFAAPEHNTSSIPFKNTTPEGVEAMAGVLWQYSDEPECLRENAPKNLCSEQEVVHGGAWNSHEMGQLQSTSSQLNMSIMTETLGARCAKSAD